MDDSSQKELTMLRSVLAGHPELFRKFYEQEAAEALKNTVMLRQVSNNSLAQLAKKAERREYPRGSLIVREGDDGSNDAIVIAQGEIRRWASIEGRKHAVDTFDKTSIGMLHMYACHPARFNAECDTDVVAYHISRTEVDNLISHDKTVSRAVIMSLADYIREHCFVLSTPLLDQRQERTSITATSLGASLESFYRSAMNNLINERLTGQRGAFFPNMHIQVPARIFYINGLKQVRIAGQEYMKTSDSVVFRAFIAFLPGVAMAPFASILEAVNAHQNPEWLPRRATRGIVPRLAREIVFGMGINQVSDYCTERANWVPNAHLQQAVGSVSAGVIAGLLSHVPHNLSTLKLQQPNVSYTAHWEKLYSRYLEYVPPTITNSVHRRRLAQFLCFTFPIGVIRRSLQIGGSFVIINGTTYACRHQDWV